MRARRDRRVDADGEIVEQHHCEEETDSRGEAIALDEAGRMFLTGIFEQGSSGYWSCIAAFE